MIQKERLRECGREKVKQERRESQRKRHNQSWNPQKHKRTWEINKISTCKETVILLLIFINILLSLSFSMLQRVQGGKQSTVLALTSSAQSLHLNQLNSSWRWNSSRFWISEAFLVIFVEILFTGWHRWIISNKSNVFTTTTTTCLPPAPPIIAHDRSLPQKFLDASMLAWQLWAVFVVPVHCDNVGCFLTYE